jgi:hypothetical protein
MPDWLLPVVTFLTGGIGGYLGASQKIVILQMTVRELVKWRKNAERTLKLYNEDLLIHDIELQASLKQLGIARARRQMAREREGEEDE